MYTHGGVFPLRRGHRDEEAFITARAILERGGCVAMYCEGARSRDGKLADRAKPGIGKLALESGAAVVPVAIYGSAKVRNWRKGEFPKVTVQYGDPVRWEQVETPTRDQQMAVADDIFGEIKARLATVIHEMLPGPVADRQSIRPWRRAFATAPARSLTASFA